MRTGNHPRRSLKYIDDLELYHTTFTDPNNAEFPTPEISHWKLAYETLDTLRQNRTPGSIYDVLVRSDEAAAMFQAMQSVRGSLSTIHAKHADAVLERLVTAAALGGVMRQEDAYRQIAVNIDLVIHLDSLDERARGGRLHRYVNQVMAIDGFAEGVNGPSHLPATNVLYRRDDPAAALIPPPRLAATMRAAGWQG